MAAAYQCTVRTDGEGGDPFAVRAGHRVLHEMMRAGGRAIDVGCRGGGCGVCRVRVLEGDYETLRMSRKHVSEAAEAEGYALACRLVPTTDLVVEPAPQNPNPST